MGSSKYVARLELVTLIAWLMKDFTWVLLLAPIAWPAALAAICLEFHSVLLEWRIDSNAMRVHGVACLLWLIGNATWMTSEMLWDSSSCYDQAKHSIFPWHHGPLAGSQLLQYKAGLHLAQSFFAAGLVLLLVFYVSSAYSIKSSPSTLDSSNPQEEIEAMSAGEEAEPMVWGVVTRQVYLMVFIGPWMLKDLFWTCELLYPALLCSVVVMALMVDGYRRFSSPVTAVEICWAVANSIWLIAELGMTEAALWPRLVAAGILAVGCSMAMLAYQKVNGDCSRDLNAKAFSESTALIGGSNDGDPEEQVKSR